MADRLQALLDSDALGGSYIRYGNDILFLYREASIVIKPEGLYYQWYADDEVAGPFPYSKDSYTVHNKLYALVRKVRARASYKKRNRY